MTQDTTKIPSTLQSLLVVAPAYALLAVLFLFLGMSAERLSHDSDPTHLLLNWGFGRPQPLYGTTVYLGPEIADAQIWCQVIGFVLATLVISLLSRRSKTLIVEIAMVVEAYILYQVLVIASPYVFPSLGERLIDPSFSLGVFIMYYIILPLAFAIRFLFSRKGRSIV